MVLCTLRQPAIKVAAGVAEAACVHLRSLAARLRLVNRELRKRAGRGISQRISKRCSSLPCLATCSAMYSHIMPGRLRMAMVLLSTVAEMKARESGLGQTLTDW
jgi:hypothetical protein